MVKLLGDTDFNSPEKLYNSYLPESFGTLNLSFTTAEGRYAKALIVLIVPSVPRNPHSFPRVTLNGKASIAIRLSSQEANSNRHVNRNIPILIIDGALQHHIRQKYTFLSINPNFQFHPRSQFSPVPDFSKSPPLPCVVFPA